MAENTKFFILDSVVISSTRQINDVDITGLVTDIAIYENIDLPFLTAELAFLDDKRLLERLDITGGEFVTIAIKSQENSDAVTKRFCIENVNQTYKNNERTEAIMLTLVEDIQFLSRFKNVNKGYEGSPTSILNSLSNEFLTKQTKITHDKQLFQQTMKLIVPNMHPLEAMMWIKNRLTDQDGYPFYLYSVLHLDNLFLAPLSGMLEQTPLNKRQPFLHGLNTGIGSEKFLNKPTFNPIPIESYTFDTHGQVSKLMESGNIGATYQYYDALTGRIDRHKFDYVKDVASELLDQDRPLTTPRELAFEEVKLNEGTSRVISRISGSGAYNNGQQMNKTIDEEDNVSNHKKRLISHAMKNHMAREGNITVRVRGQGFLSPGQHKTIGNMFRFLFYANRAAEDNNLPIDRKKSGDYMIHSAKHVFSKERYDVHLTGYKLQHFKEDQIPIE